MDISIGNPYPLGATITKSGVNFAITTHVADQIEISLFNSKTEALEQCFVLPGKTGDIWHGCISGIKKGQYYGVRVRDAGKSQISEKLLIDPYAKQLSRPIQYDSKHYQGDSHAMIPKSIVVGIDNANRPEKPFIKPWKRVIYEAHVKGLTQTHSSIKSELQGTYLGAAHPDVIEHIRSLGVTTVQFMPLFAFMPEPYITNKGLTNYWGYNPVCYFAPEPRYAYKDGVSEIKTMIDSYHAAGIEVILDVVFNHTAEASEEGPTLCLRGLFGPEVYLHVQDKKGQSHYANYSGCGNTVNSAHPFMFAYILDALRYWIIEIGIDGFRFDLAPGLGREPHTFNRLSGLIKAMLQDPILKDAVLISEPWDMGPEGYQLGAFPYPWLEVNDKYRDTVRGFWRGDSGLVGEFATRMMGSRDIFSKAHRPNHSSVNCISYHDGFTLHDLVTYSDKHNLANGEDNRDGHNHNLSGNYGVEGETDNEQINAIREKQKRNLFACLLFSQGTPHIVAGDEISRTQQGNNNAYCQDNEISWLDWSLTKRKENFLAFCKHTIALRQSSQILGNMQLDDDTFSHIKNVAQVNWYKPDGKNKASEDWQDHDNRSFALEIIGASSKTDKTDKKDNTAVKNTAPERWLLCVNASDMDVEFYFPKFPKSTSKGEWTLRLDTRYDDIANMPLACVQNMFLQESHSLAILSL